MSLKVLLADDSMTAQNMGKKILSESGYDVTTVSNGAAAVKKIAEVKPDLVILDIYMPGYTGLEVCERVRANFDTANLPVLLTVGKMEPYRAEDGAKVRADGVIVKPFEATDLLAIVKKMAERVPSGAVKRVVNEEPEPEEEVQQYSHPEPSMPTHVDVPSEIAVAPALAMEEFNTGQGEVSTFTPPAMTWGAFEAPAAETSHPSTDAPWSFDQPATLDAPVIDSSAASVEPAPDVEFTSAPQVGEVEVQQSPELELHKEEAPVVAEDTHEESLASAQEITDFATSFSTAPVEEAHVAEESKALEATAGETSWNGWAHADATAAEETKPEGVIDDFEAKVAAAMSGFSTEPVQHVHEAANNEISAEPVDDFEARVAAAMSGFATEPIASNEAPAAPAEPEPVVAEPEPIVEAEHHETPATESADDFEARVAAAMSGFTTEETHVEETVAEVHAEPVVEATPVAEAAPASADDFDARLAEAMSSFDTTPEPSAVPEPSFKPQDETQEIETPAPLKPAINLNETMVLPQEAALSLEEEMKQALELTAPAEEAAPAPVAPEAISWEPPTAEAHEPEHQELEEAAGPEALGEFDPMHVAHEADAAWGHQAEPVEEAAAAAASSMLNSAVNSNGNAKLADAVHRAIDRLKPQLIAEIVKELKGE